MPGVKSRIGNNDSLPPAEFVVVRRWECLSDPNDAELSNTVYIRSIDSREPYVEMTNKRTGKRMRFKRGIYGWERVL